MTDTKLDELKSKLQQRGLSASLRGRGQATFLFAEHQKKAIEVSEHGEQWWVEFWDVSEDEDAAPAKDRFFSTVSQVVDAITDWLPH